MLRSISRSATLLTLFLSAALVMACIGIVFPAMRVTSRLKLTRTVPKEVPPQDEPIKEAAAPLPTDYAVVGEMNLFHPQRMIPIDVKAQLPKPELFLCAIIRYGSDLVAFVEDKKKPATSPGRGNRQTVVRKGTVYAGYSVTEINNDSIVLARGDQSVSVYLVDPGKRGGKSTPSAPTETTTPSAPRPSSSSSATASQPPPPPRPSSMKGEPSGQPPSGGAGGVEPSPVPPHRRGR